MNTKAGGLMALLAVGLAGGVQAQEAKGERSGFFVSGGLGINFLEDLEIPVGGPVGTTTWKFDPGSRFTAGVGYQLYQNSAISIAIAAETGFLYNTLDEVTAGGLGTADADGDFTQVPFLGKVVLKFMPESQISPFIGVGGGGVFSELQVDEINGSEVDQGGDETDPAIQGEAGVRYALNDEIGLGLSYKCFVLIPDGDVDELISHSINFVFSWAF